MNQIDIFSDSPKKSFNIQKGLNVINNGSLLFFPNFFNTLESNDFFAKLKEETAWKQEAMKMYGKNILFPRLTAWYGDADKAYSFSGISLNPEGWTHTLAKIKNRIEPVAETIFNSVLLNLYRNGNDSISWHTDAEKELGINPTIGSVNFGATRLFQLKHITTNEKIDVPLTNGSLLIMKGETQHHWKHQVPKTAKFVKERINLTFRVII